MFSSRKKSYQGSNGRDIAFHFIVSEFLLFQMGNF